MSPTELLTVRQAAERLGISPSLVYALCAGGVIAQAPAVVFPCQGDHRTDPLAVRIGQRDALDAAAAGLLVAQDRRRRGREARQDHLPPFARRRFGEDGTEVAEAAHTRSGHAAIIFGGQALGMQGGQYVNSSAMHNAFWVTVAQAYLGANVSTALNAETYVKSGATPISGLWRAPA